jgi:hypothetical protein
VSAGECPRCHGPLERRGGFFCPACGEKATCMRDACLVEEWRVGGFCSTHCADLAEVEEERDDAIAEAAGLCLRNVDLEKERDEALAAIAEFIAAADAPRTLTDLESCAERLTRYGTAVEALRRVARKQEGT